MSNIQISVDDVAQRFGIGIIDVRLRRADLPDQAAQAIYARMRSEREREAREARAQGFEKAQQIRSSADRERTVLLAEAEKQAEVTRGIGDKTARALLQQWGTVEEVVKHIDEIPNARARACSTFPIPSSRPTSNNTQAAGSLSLISARAANRSACPL